MIVQLYKDFSANNNPPLTSNKLLKILTEGPGQMKTESIKNKAVDSMRFDNLQHDYRSDSSNKMELNHIEEGTNNSINKLSTVKKLVPRYLPLNSSNFSNHCTVIYGKGDKKRLMFPMEVLQRIKHSVLKKYVNVTKGFVQDTYLHLDVITNCGRIEVDEQMLYICAYSERLIEETGCAVAAYMKEVNKALSFNSISVAKDTPEITVDLSHHLSNLFCSDIDIQVGCEVIECLALDSLEILAAKAACTGVNNVSENVKGGLLLHKINQDSIFAQVIDPSIDLSHGVAILRINGIFVRSKYDLYVLWNCMKVDAYNKMKQGLAYHLEVTFLTKNNKMCQSIYDSGSIVSDPKISDFCTFDIDNLKYEVQDMSEGHSDDVSIQQLNNSQHIQLNNFRQKISPLFQSVPAGCEKKLLKQMWDAHCTIFGKQCGEECTCILNIPRLCEGISEKDDESGFFLHFCPRFHEKLRKEFPGEFVMSHIRFLLFLWELHKSRVKLGDRCFEFCCCTDFWTQFLHDLNIYLLTQSMHKIDIKNMPRLNLERSKVNDKETRKVLNIETCDMVVNNSCTSQDQDKIERNATQSQDNVSVTQSIRPTGVSCIIDSSAKSESSEVNSLSGISNESASNSVNTQIKRKLDTLPDEDSTQGRLKQVCKDVRNEESFKISFDVNNPLGFYCYTKKYRYRSYCLIFSVCPTKPDKRLKRGLIIDKTSTTNDDTIVKKVSSYDTLKRRYEAAKSKSENLIIWFLSDVNLANDEDIVTQYPETAPFWASTGSWKGPTILGWAGGAEIELSDSVNGNKQIVAEKKVLKLDVKYSLKRDPSPSLKSTATKMAEISASTVLFNALPNDKSLLKTKVQRVSFDESCKESDIESESKSYKRKNKNESTHSWTDKIKKQFYCQKCEKRRLKLQTCELCQYCHSCGVKFPCPNESKGYAGKKVKRFDQFRLLGKRYQLALKTAFGLSSVTTLEYNVESKDDETKLETSEKVNPDISVALELINQEPSLINKALIGPVDKSADNLLNPLTSKTILFATAMYAKYDIMRQLLMAEADITYKDNNNKTPLDYIREYCDKLQSELRNTDTSDKARLKAKITDLVFKRDLLSIFLLGTQLREVYSVVKSCYTLQVSVDGGTNIHLTDAGKSHSAQSNLYCVISWDKKKDAYTTSTIPLTAAPSWASSQGYFLNVNGMDKNMFQSKYIKFELYKGNPDGKNIKLSSISERGEVVNHHANTSGTTGEFVLPETEMLSSGALVITVRKILYGRDKSVSKPLIDNEVKKRKNQLSVEVPKLVDDIIKHFEAVKRHNRNPSNGEDPALLLQNEYAPSVLNRMKLLHCAVYLEDVSVVKRLVSCNANINEYSMEGSPLELARTLKKACVSDSLNEIVSILLPSTKVSDLDQTPMKLIETQSDSVKSKELSSESKCITEANSTSNLKAEENNNRKAPVDSNLKIVSPVTNTKSAPPQCSPLPASLRSVSADAQIRHSKIKFPPNLDNPNWMAGGLKPCFSYNLKGLCPKGADCKFVHIFVPEPGLLNVPYHSDVLNRNIENKFGKKLHLTYGFQERSRKGRDGRLWHTAAYKLPKSLKIYYASGGRYGICSDQNVWWYPSMENARCAVEFLVLTDLEHSKDGNSMLESVFSNEVPILDNPDWMMNFPKSKICFAYKQISGQFDRCQKGNSCKFAHVFTPQCFIPQNSYEAGGLSRAYELRYNKLLKSSDFQQLSRKGKNSQVVWYTASFLCPATSTIYNSCRGSNGKFSSQLIWWYPSRSDALCAVEGLVLTDLKFRNDAESNKIEFDARRNGCEDGNVERVSPTGTEKGDTDKSLLSPVRHETLTPRENKNSSLGLLTKVRSPSLEKFGPIPIHALKTSREGTSILPCTTSLLDYMSPPQLFRKFGPSPVQANPPPNKSPSQSMLPKAQSLSCAVKLTPENQDHPLNIPQERPSSLSGKGAPSLPPKIPSPPLGKFGQSLLHALSSTSEITNPSTSISLKMPPRKFDSVPFHENLNSSLAKQQKCPPSPPLGKFHPVPFASQTTSEIKQESPSLTKADVTLSHGLSSSLESQSSTLVSQHTTEKKSNSNIFGNSHLPILEKPHWMLAAPKCNPCFAFNAAGGCLKGIKCKYAHVHIPQSETMEDAYEIDAIYNFYKEKYRIELHHNDFHQLCKAGKSNLNWCAAAFRCPKTSTIYYASGGQNGQYSNQKNWWYPTREDARHAVEGVVLSDLKNRNLYTPAKGIEEESSESSDSDDDDTPVFAKFGMNAFHMLAMASSDKPKKCSSKEVPTLEKRDWILDEIGKNSCPSFNRSGVCKGGKQCKYAHVYDLKGTLPELPPDPRTLFLTYEKFGFSFGSCNRYFRSQQGRNGKMWYTAGIMCPIDSTIYYAAGGADAHRSKQKLCTSAQVFWYPSEESAKAACDGIVLYALRDRGKVTNRRS